MNKEKTKAKLILEDGTEFSGYSFGYEGNTNGEVVFNTGMVGYPETLTDPSYRGQILVCTFPLIGNYGVPSKESESGLLKNFESDKIQVRGLVVSDYSFDYSHWSSEKSLADWLKEEKISAIYGIDTRMLTRKLRDKGTMLGKIVIDESSEFDFDDPNKKDLVAEVSVKEPIEYSAGKKKIILVDCGTKNNIIRAFLLRNITVIRVPYDYDFNAIKADGIMLSNGPGDPKMNVATIEHTKKAMEKNKPILGICLGSQILALAARADTYKLKYGHRGHNQPCNELGTKRCYITSQNHGYAVDASTLTEDWREWFVNDNDGTNEGIIHISKPFFASQFHPEASPGPDDCEFIFDMFVRALK
ncbi:Carbamoylphosphate synthase small subunit [Ignavibacterium album JCM 16511]|uniref:Carbamoyl phosphate synthase small chain n=1 Tax=Ignavibacterium album (strain DSM 19864 / JCM 16511 / NBRC 101810 / Mat9-16) TaxID=945713 RepID=I0AN91_IGNAJ|nr:glutamine-hydrolyzing carbamoyl-phosphate synthase small subunit [Ignavibacterium album]AFH50448.1 Carbamoylphosphate synthase small subunit [Ignavibacterium album JCM 16511]